MSFCRFYKPAIFYKEDTIKNTNDSQMKRYIRQGLENTEWSNFHPCGIRVCCHPSVKMHLPTQKLSKPGLYFWEPLSHFLFIINLITSPFPFLEFKDAAESIKFLSIAWFFLVTDTLPISIKEHIKSCLIGTQGHSCLLRKLQEI